jgi:hypothetical protein
MTYWSWFSYHAAYYLIEADLIEADLLETALIETEKEHMVIPRLPGKTD